MDLLGNGTNEMNYKPWERISSRTELKKAYESAVREALEARKDTKIDRVMLKQVRTEAEELKNKTIEQGKKIIVLTKDQKLKDENKKSMAWSGASVVSASMLYQLWDIVGYPFGARFDVFWNHEAVFGTISFFLTVFYTTLYKTLNK